MQKGKYGICLPFYAILAFVLAFLGQILLCALLLGFVIAAEKDEWLTKQVMQAFFLSLFYSLITTIFSVSAISNLFGGAWYMSGILGIFGTIFSIITGLVSLAVLIFVIIGIVRVAKGLDAEIPVFHSLANRAFGLVAQKVYNNVPPQYQYPPQYQQNPQQQPYQAPNDNQPQPPAAQ